MTEDTGTEAIRYTLGSRGWEEHLRPMGETEKARMEAAARLTLEERGSPKFSDEFLRGYLRGLEFFLVRPYRLLQERDNEAAKDKKANEATSNEGVGDPYSPLKTTG